MSRLNGVAAAGTLAEVDVKASSYGRSRSTIRWDRPRCSCRSGPHRRDCGGRCAPRLSPGRFPDAGHSARGDRVAVLGLNAARRLSITNLEQQPAIFIGDRLYQVIGLLDTIGRQVLAARVDRDPERHRAPGVRARRARLGPGRDRGRRGRADRPSGAEGPQPDEPRAAPRRGSAGPEVRCAAAWRTTSMRCSCCSAAVSLLVGALGIANVTLVSVLERVGEIGLRRALGAARRHIAAQFLIESTVMGLLGGIIGASLGTWWSWRWPPAGRGLPCCDPWVPLAAPLVGALIGLLSGTYPSMRAAGWSPSRRCARGPHEHPPDISIHRSSVPLGNTRKEESHEEPAPTTRPCWRPWRSPRSSWPAAATRRSPTTASWSWRTGSASARTAPSSARAGSRSAIQSCMKAQGFDYIPVDPFAQQRGADRQGEHQGRGVHQAVRLRDQHVLRQGQRAVRPQRRHPQEPLGGRPCGLRPRALRRQPRAHVRGGGRHGRHQRAGRLHHARPRTRCSAAPPCWRASRRSWTGWTSACSRTSAW